MIWYGSDSGQWTRSVVSTNPIYSGREGDVDGDGDLDIFGSSHCCRASGNLYFYKTC